MLNKVLIISHNSISVNQNMGKTLGNLFSGYKVDELAQLYFYPSIPPQNKCKDFYRITDNDIYMRLLRRKETCGGPIYPVSDEEKLYDSIILKKKYTFFKKYRSRLLVFRDIIWRNRYWNSEDLKIWLKKVSPDVIFFAAGDSIFSYRITLHLARMMEIPIVVYFCDDFYTHYSIISVIGKIHHLILKRYIRKICHISRKQIFITDELNRMYKIFCDREGYVIRTPICLKRIKEKKISKPLIVSFFGNITLNRWRTLYSLATAIKRVNENDVKVILNIYSSCEDKKIINKLTIDNSSFFKGFVNKREMVLRIQESDVLLHVESFKSKDIKRVKSSFSTKLSDYLSVERVILGVGPLDVASLSFLSELNLGYIINQESLIYENLRDFVNNFGYYQRKYGKRTENFINNNSIKKNSVIMKSILNKGTDNENYAN